MEKKGLGKPKVSLQFELHHNGIAQLVKAEAAVEETYTVQVEVEVEDETIDADKKPEDADETNKTEDKTAKSEGDDKKEETESKEEKDDDKEDKKENKEEDKKKDKKEEKKKKKTKMVEKVRLLVLKDLNIGIRIHTQMIVVWLSPEKTYLCCFSTGKEACPQENIVGGKVLRHKSHSHVGSLVCRVQGQT